MTRRLAVLAAFAFVLACGGGTTTTHTPDESADETGGGDRVPGVALEIPSGLGGTEWRWAATGCTEGPLDLASRNYTGRMRIRERDDGSILVMQDHVYGDTGCAVTTVTRVSEPSVPGELDTEEIARVSVPSTPDCFGQPEAPRPGEVRRAGRNLELLVQRSRWCGGFEVTFQYTPEMPRMRTNDEIARHYAIYFSLGDADAIAGLFAETSSLAEPFTTTSTGDPFRHEGREAIRSWYADAFAGTAWRALRIIGTSPGATDSEVSVFWEYMDSRLVSPITGANHFTVAAGEIFETRVELSSDPVVEAEFGAH